MTKITMANNCNYCTTPLFQESFSRIIKLNQLDWEEIQSIVKKGTKPFIETQISPLTFAQG